MPAPSLNVTVTSTAPALSARVRRLARTQLPFATAKSLTRLAQEARDVQRDAMPRRFKLRNRRVVSGITMVRAERRDWPKPFSLVATRDPFIARHEEGGVVKPQEGHPYHAVPTTAVARRRLQSGKLPKGIRARRLLQSGKAEIKSIKGGRAIVLKRKRRRTLGETMTAFTIHRTVRLKKALRLVETVGDVAARRYFPIFQGEIRAALKSAR